VVGTRIAGKVACPECGTCLSTAHPEAEVLVAFGEKDLGYLGRCRNEHPLGLRKSTNAVEVLPDNLLHPEELKYLRRVRAKQAAP